MSDDPTKKNPGDGKEFSATQDDDRISVLISAVQLLSTDFQEVKVRLTSLEKSVSEHSYETKPIWERALAEIAATRAELAAMRAELAETRSELGETRSELRAEMRDGFRRLGSKMDVLNSDLLTVRGEQRLLEKRVEDLESKAS